jgi:hypothetical protein
MREGRAWGRFTGLLWGFVAFSGAQAETRRICFINGADGMNQTFHQEIPALFKDQYDLEFVPLDVGARGEIAAKSYRLMHLVNEILQERPNFQCHLYAYSMGGVVARYAFAHEKIQRDNRDLDWSQVFRTYTTFATPHRGTPVADLIAELFPQLRGRGLETLSERSMYAVNDERDPGYWGVPPMTSFSYSSYLASRQDAATLSHKVFYDFITKDSKIRGVDPRNDGMVPLRSQSYGRNVATLRVPHSYFGLDPNLRSSFALGAEKLFKMHWDCLEKGRSDLWPAFLDSGYFAPNDANPFCH